MGNAPPHANDGHALGEQLGWTPTDYRMQMWNPCWPVILPPSRAACEAAQHPTCASPLFTSHRVVSVKWLESLQLVVGESAKEHKKNSELTSADLEGGGEQ